MTFIDSALASVFRRCNVDAGRIIIAGFPDGASFALPLGLVNGDLFRKVVAFSPGFVVLGSGRASRSSSCRTDADELERQRVSEWQRCVENFADLSGQFGHVIRFRQVL